MSDTVPIWTPCGLVLAPRDGTPVDCWTFHLGVERSGLLHPKFKALVNGTQVGLISSIEVKQGMLTPIPEVRVSVLQGLSHEQFKQYSDSVKKSARQTVEELRRFPNVTVVCPEYLT